MKNKGEIHMDNFKRLEELVLEEENVCIHTFLWPYDLGITYYGFLSVSYCRNPKRIASENRNNRQKRKTDLDIANVFILDKSRKKFILIKYVYTKRSKKKVRLWTI